MLNNFGSIKIILLENTEPVDNVMRIFILTLLISLAKMVTAQKNIADSNFHLYLLIGQSNMAGRGLVDTESKKTDEKILMLDVNAQWQLATDPVHFDKPGAVGVGPAISFAKAMLKENNKIKIGLIPCAWGGSPLRVWKPGEKYLHAYPYDDALIRTQRALKDGVLKGILWHQGESDNDSVRSATYLNRLKVFIEQLRHDLLMPDVPFVAGEIGYFNKNDYINTFVNELPKNVPYTAVVRAVGLTDKGDHLHFDTPSARELGKRYARTMQQLLLEKDNSYSGSSNTNEKPTVILTFDDAEISHYTNVAPLLKKYGFGATFMVCEMARKPADSLYYMNWQQIAALHKMGFEIGNHTGHHKNMTTLTVDEMKVEVRYIEDKCRQYNIPVPVSFAYPGNRHDSLSQIVLRELGYRFARTGGSSFYNPLKNTHLAIPSYTMGATEKLAERTWKALKTVQSGQVLVFTVHGVPDLEHPDYTTTITHFEQLLQYMKANNFRVVPLKDLY